MRLEYLLESFEVPRSRPRVVLAFMMVALMMLSLAPSLYVGTADVDIDSGPYVLTMHFSELPRPWWNETQCQFRQRVTVMSGSLDALAGTEVLMPFDHSALVLAGKSQADGDDVRIVFWNNIAWVELDRILDPGSAWNDTITSIWFALQEDIPASSSDDRYYMYYGNSMATNPPTNATSGGGVKSLQSGTAVSSSNGVVTIPISPVDMSKSFLMFNARHNGGRPVNSEIRGRMATSTLLEFVRVTDEMSPVPMTVKWFVVEYHSGVRVQRGQIASQASTVINVPTAPIVDVGQAFVLWSKTPFSGDVNWSSDDPTIGELTNSSNVQFRVYGANSGHAIWWQVVEFTNPGDAFVQKGSVYNMIETTTSVNATLATPVDVNRTFVLVSFNVEGSGPDVGARMLRAQLVNSTTIMIDRSISGFQENITEISWQAVELNDGSRVLSGSESFGLGEDTRTVTLASAVDTSRSVAFASVHPSTGQSMGRSPYSGDDVIGVGSVTMALTANNITMVRDSTADVADIGWFVVELGADDATTTLGPEETDADVAIRISVHHVAPDGSDPQLIVASPAYSIKSDTPNPLIVTIGTGAVHNFTDADPRYLRLEIDVQGGGGDERCVLAYDSIPQPSSLVIPTTPSSQLYLHDQNASGLFPEGRIMDSAMGSSGSSLVLYDSSDIFYWYMPLWSLPSVSVDTPLQDEHLTGTYDTQYSISSGVANVTFAYHDGISWNFLGYDTDLDGVFTWDSCLVGDQVVTLRATVRDSFGITASDSVTGVEIDCTPPSVQILLPSDDSIVQDDVMITYVNAPDAVTVELRYNDGQLHTISTDTPPDGSAVWNVSGLTLKGALLTAQAWDEVGLSSMDVVVGLSTPQPPPPVNKPPTISGVPDLVVHYDHSYNFDLTPYIEDEDNASEDLTVYTSDPDHIWIGPGNNLGLVMNYPQSMLNETVVVTIWVTDGIGIGFDVINVTISTDYPPEQLRPLPDVTFNEDETRLNVFSTNLDYYFLDVDGDNLYYTSGNRSVSIRINPDRTVDMWAARDWYGFELVTVRATDPTQALVEQLLIVQVLPVNDAPVIDHVPDVELWAGKLLTIDLAPYIHDVDSNMSALNISVDSEYVEVSGFNITLKYPKDVKGETITITVGDGLDSSVGFVIVVVRSEIDWFILWVMIVSALVAVLLWAAYIAHSDQILAGYLLRNDGSLVTEILLSENESVPLESIIEKASGGIEKVKKLDFDRYKVTVLHGQGNHLAVVSTWFLSRNVVGKLNDTLSRLYGGESTASVKIREFKESFTQIAKGRRSSPSSQE